MPKHPKQPRARAKGAWTFYDKPDIARVLRESRDAGFDLVEVRTPTGRHIYATEEYVVRCQRAGMPPCYDFTLISRWCIIHERSSFRGVYAFTTAREMHAELLRREAADKAWRNANRVTVVGYA